MALQSSEPAFHGYAPQAAQRGYRPPLSIVISRETGARGRSIAERVAELLQRKYVDQESLEYLTQGAPAGTDGRSNIETEAAKWVDLRLAEMTREGTLARNPQIAPLVRSILQAASEEACVILGRGAGTVIPPDARLHVKIVSPIETRIAFMAQMKRFSPVEAEQYVVEKDHARDEFLAARLGVDPADLSQFDLVVNTPQFGVEACARLIASAAQEKEGFLQANERASQPSFEGGS